jgi:hypothetical protein
MVIRIEGASVVTVNLPDFDPALYPEAFRSLPIVGYVSGSYYNPQRSGEGIFVELDPAKVIAVAWFSFDQNGAPFWLVGAAPVCPDSASICPSPPEFTEIELRAYAGGGFAGQLSLNFQVQHPTSSRVQAWDRSTHT